MIAADLFIGPGLVAGTQKFVCKAGSTKMTNVTTELLCVGIDVGKAHRAIG